MYAGLCQIGDLICAYLSLSLMQCVTTAWWRTTSPFICMQYGAMSSTTSMLTWRNSLISWHRTFQTGLIFNQRHQYTKVFSGAQVRRLAKPNSTSKLQHSYKSHTSKWLDVACCRQIVGSSREVATRTSFRPAVKQLSRDQELRCQTEV